MQYVVLSYSLWVSLATFKIEVRFWRVLAIVMGMWVSVHSGVRRHAWDNAVSYQPKGARRTRSISLEILIQVPVSNGGIWSSQWRKAVCQPKKQVSPILGDGRALLFKALDVLPSFCFCREWVLPAWELLGIRSPRIPDRAPESL